MGYDGLNYSKEAFPTVPGLRACKPSVKLACVSTNRVSRADKVHG